MTWQHHRPAADHVQRLGPGRAHAGALAGGEDDRRDAHCALGSCRRSQPVRAAAARPRHRLRGEESNPYSRNQNQLSYRLNDPGRSSTAHAAGVPITVAGPPDRPVACAGPYGFADQEAPQADAQEEAQEDAPPHPPPAPQVVRSRRARRPRATDHRRPRPARRRGRRRARRARTTSPRCRPAPGVCPVSSAMRSRHRQRRLDDDRRRLEVVGPVRRSGPPSSSQARYTAGVLTQRRDDQRHGQRSTTAAARRPRRSR